MQRRKKKDKMKIAETNKKAINERKKRHEKRKN